MVADASIETGPELDVAQAGAARVSGGRWSVPFTIANRGGTPVELTVAWLPHGRFRCAERQLSDLPLPAKGQTELSFEVQFDEQPGTEVVNAFVILQVRWREVAWRVMTRLTVTARADGAPEAATQLVTTHRIGFSG